jgi:hypothetical protein
MTLDETRTDLDERRTRHDYIRDDDRVRRGIDFQPLDLVAFVVALVMTLGPLTAYAVGMA